MSHSTLKRKAEATAEEVMAMAQVVKDGMGIENEEAFALALLLLSESNEEIKQLFWGGGATGARNRRGNKRRDRGFALSQMEELSDDEFRRMFTPRHVASSTRPRRAADHISAKHRA